jgi:hypothetical protein
MVYVLRKGLLVPKRKVEKPKRPRFFLRRRLPDIRFPHIWVPKIIPAKMAVSLNATGTVFDSTADHTNIPASTGFITIAAGANTSVFFFVCTDINPGAFTTKTWAGATLQQVGTAVNTTGILFLTIFYLKAPTTGNQSLALTWSTSVNEVAVQSIAFNGVDQTTTTSGFQNFTFTSNSTLAANASATLSITSANGNASIGAFNNDGGWAATPITSGTQLFGSTGANFLACGAYNLDSSSPSIITAHNGTNADNYCAIGCNIVAAGGGGGGVVTQGILGLASSEW